MSGPADREETEPLCWCGGSLGDAVAPHYRRCTACGSAVLTPRPAASHFDVVDDDVDFYGRSYWTAYAMARNFPTIDERARLDLSERCAFWVERTLAAVEPPGRALEIGCGHGGFVRLLRELGFDAAGTELSPWVADFARRRFEVPVLQGRLEDLALEPGFRCIAAFDVLEHLDDPLDATRRCRELLTCDGVLLVQTPCYRGEGPEWSMFQPDEHIHLLSERAVCLLLHRAGFESVSVQPSLFPYDMWVVARPHDPAADGPAVAGESRIPAAFQALLDLRRRAAELDETVARIDADRSQRLAQVDQLTGENGELACRLAASDTDRITRLALIEELTGQLQDVLARLGISDADREARLQQINDLTGQLEVSEADRAARLAQIVELTERVTTFEAHATAFEAHATARLEQIDALTGRLAASEAATAAALGEVDDLRRRLAASEADREAQRQLIRTLDAELEAIRRTWVWRLYRPLGRVP